MSTPAPRPPHRPARPRKPRDEPGVERGYGRFPRGLALRLFVYVVAGHLLAGFLFLLFEVGGGE
ncbi:DUF6126 family protein [Streptomyces diacarni]|uniref:Small hydrophobic protein n=1 Tax=Streptomyces diacarni TaxID=2800381 RepID=A0A367FBR5_9ACTN|nr:DUF6126 family protein [Streptomyces diacarni]RCG27135.1 hypothetical protein DTL70_05450 [Streptomyces diacarni]